MTEERFVLCLIAEAGRHEDPDLCLRASPSSSADVAYHGASPAFSHLRVPASIILLRIPSKDSLIEVRLFRRQHTGAHRSNHPDNQALDAFRSEADRRNGRDLPGRPAVLEVQEKNTSIAYTAF